jgi:hypothetical protein
LYFIPGGWTKWRKERERNEEVRERAEEERGGVEHFKSHRKRRPFACSNPFPFVFYFFNLLHLT